MPLDVDMVAKSLFAAFCDHINVEPAFPIAYSLKPKANRLPFSVGHWAKIC